MLRHEPQDAFHINTHWPFIVYGGVWYITNRSKQVLALIGGGVDSGHGGGMDLFWVGLPTKKKGVRKSYLQNVETLSLPEM